MQYFINRELEITKKKDFENILLKISNSLFALSNSEVFLNRLAIGGVYHKNYYDIICRGFYNNKNIVFIAKNALKSEFLYNLKHNLCNYGIYFYTKYNKLFLKIYSGNSFLMDDNQLNFVEKNINQNKVFSKNNIKYTEFENYYEKNILEKLKPFNFKIFSENKYLLNLINKFNLSQNNCKRLIKINNDLTYKIYIEKKEINLKKVFKNFRFYDTIDDEIIKTIHIKNIDKIVNQNFLIYNNKTNYFDIFKTIQYLSWRFTNDKDYSKLV